MTERKLFVLTGRSDEPAENAGADLPPEYQRFADLTRKLVKVPKSEVDEKRQKA